MMDARVRSFEMATNYITIKGVIENGELKVELPENVQDGEVEVTIAVGKSEQLPSEAASLTDEEIDASMRPEPKSGAEIIAAGHLGGWENEFELDGAVITRMMRTSMWDMYLKILKEVRD
jgi:hypothetical protein